jgi:hypothetical protein
VGVFVKTALYWGPEASDKEWEAVPNGKMIYTGNT